jgi:phage terminase small subunit
MALTAKQEAFCNEYLVDLNATQAAIRAGYSANTAQEIGAENLSKPIIKECLATRMKDRRERTEIDADYVLKRLAAIDQMDVADILNDDGTMKGVKDWPEVWRRTINGMDVSELFDGSGGERVLAGLLKKIKFPDKLKNLELMGKHVTVGAFKEVVDNRHSLIGPDGKPMRFNVNITFVKPGDVQK